MNSKRIAKELIIMAKKLIAIEPIFDADDADEIVRKMKSKIKAPFVSAQVSVLGGKERASVLVRISLDPKSEWANNIFQNSRFFQIRLDRAGTLEQFTMSHTIPKKLRKSRVKSLDDAIKKLNAYIAMVDRMKSSSIKQGVKLMNKKQIARQLIRIAKKLTAGGTLIDLVIDARKLGKLRNQMDEQTYDLMVEVYRKLSKDLNLTSGQQEALNRLRSSMEGRFKPDMHRNNIFKAAHALGFKLPSSMF